MGQTRARPHSGKYNYARDSQVHQGQCIQQLQVEDNLSVLFVFSLLLPRSEGGFDVLSKRVLQHGGDVCVPFTCSHINR